MLSSERFVACSVGAVSLRGCLVAVRRPLPVVRGDNGVLHVRGATHETPVARLVLPEPRTDTTATTWSGIQATVTEEGSSSSEASYARSATR